MTDNVRRSLEALFRGPGLMTTVIYNRLYILYLPYNDYWPKSAFSFGAHYYALTKFAWQNLSGQPKKRSNSASKMGGQFCQKSKMGKE